MMQNFGLEDLSHVQSRRNLLKYLVRVEMASDWFTRIYRSNKHPKSRFGVQTRLRALLEPAIIKTKNKYILFQILNLKENIQSIKIKKYLENFQYFKAESVILGKTLILKLVNLKLRLFLV